MLNISDTRAGMVNHGENDVGSWKLSGDEIQFLSMDLKNVLFPLLRVL